MGDGVIIPVITHLSSYSVEKKKSKGKLTSLHALLLLAHTTTMRSPEQRSSPVWFSLKGY